MKSTISKFTSIALFLAGSATLGFADDISVSATPYKSEKKKFFSFDGQLSTFTKAGFNNAKVDTTNGQYPTESFSTIFGAFNTHYDILAFMNNDSINKFEFGLSAAAGGLTLDSTLRDGSNASGGLSGGSGLNNNYYGGWAGYLSELGGYLYKNNRFFIIPNAYVDFSMKLGSQSKQTLNIKAGRYESSMDYFSGFTQGFNIDYTTAYGDKDLNKIKAWWFSSFGRAFAYSEWFLDFYAVKTTTLSDGSVVNFGNHAFGVDILNGGFSKSNDGYELGQSLLVRPFFYFYPGLYEAPGMKFVYNKQFGNGFGLTTTLQGYVLHVQPKFTTKYSGSNHRYDESVDEWSGNVNLIVQANIYNYNARIGYYQNFGSANSHFGTYGNPMGFDFWTASVYDIGASISDVINRNAVTGYLSGGGSYNLKYGTLTWDILGRITRSPRSDEESVALNITHAFKNHIALGLKLEWFRDTTHAGYNPGATIGGQKLSATRTDDRSHAFITFDYTF